MKVGALELLVILFVLSPLYILSNSDPVIDIENMRSKTVFVGCANGSGSGVVVRADGYIITNKHVTENCLNIYVVIGEKRLDADILKEHADKDMAIIKIEGYHLAAELNIRPKKGQRVFAIGSPFGIVDVVSTGVVGTIKDMGFQKYIIHDADIYPGNSGGALFDKQGRLLGINTRGYVTMFGTMAMAIPSSDIQDFLTDYFKEVK